MKQIQFNPRHRVALFCNNQNEKFCLLEFVQVGFNICVYYSEKWASTESVHNTECSNFKTELYHLKWFWYFNKHQHHASEIAQCLLA